MINKSIPACAGVKKLGLTHTSLPPPPPPPLLFPPTSHLVVFPLSLPVGIVVAVPITCKCATFITQSPRTVSHEAAESKQEHKTSLRVEARPREKNKEREISQKRRRREQQRRSSFGCKRHGGFYSVANEDGLLRNRHQKRRPKLYFLIRIPLG